MPPKHSQHLFIVSTGSPQKSDVNSTYQRRAHAARVSRRRALEKSAAATKQASGSHLPTTAFHEVKALQEQPDLLEALSHLAFFNASLFRPPNSSKTRPSPSSTKSKRGNHDSKIIYTSLLRARALLLSLPSQTNGLAFLPAKQLIYEATRYAAMIYVNMLVADPLIRAKLVSAVTLPTTSPTPKRTPARTNPAAQPTQPPEIESNTDAPSSQTGLPADIIDFATKNSAEILHGKPLQRQLYQSLEIKAYFSVRDSNNVDVKEIEDVHPGESLDHKIPRHPSYALRYVLNSLFKDVCWRQDFGVMAWATFLGVVGSLPPYSQPYTASSAPHWNDEDPSASGDGGGENAAEDEDELWARVNEERRKSDLEWLLSQLRERVVQTKGLTQWGIMKGLLEHWLWCEGRLGEDIGQRVWRMVLLDGMNDDGGDGGEKAADTEMTDVPTHS